MDLVQCESTKDSVLAFVEDLGGNILEITNLAASESVGGLKQRISVAWALEANSFRLLADSVFLEDTAEIKSIVANDGEALRVQLVKFDPLPDLGRFDASKHKGIETTGDGSVLIKCTNNPDSNNVFLHQHIYQACFAEFHVVQSRDEISFGVTYEAEQVEKLDGFSNLRREDTWIFSKKKSMPALLFGGKSIREDYTGRRQKCGESWKDRQEREGVGVSEGDRIAVYADPQERLVKFYKNGIFVASNLPDHPLPEESERPLRMYVMLDASHDEVSVLRFGPGDPYDSDCPCKLTVQTNNGSEC